MQVGRGPYHWRHCRIRNTVTSSPSGCTTTGTRASLSSLSSDILLTENSLVNRDALMEEYVRLMQNMLRSTSTIKKRAKSVYQSKNLGTIKNRKKEKQQTTKEDSNGEIILRILRMRYLSWALGLKFTFIGLI